MSRRKKSKQLCDPQLRQRVWRKIPWKEIFLVILGALAAESAHIVATRISKQRPTINAVFMSFPYDREERLKGRRQYLLLSNISDDLVEDISVFSANPRTHLLGADVLHPAAFTFSIEAEGELTIPSLRPRETVLFTLVARRSSLTYFDGDLRIVAKSPLAVELFRPSEAVRVINEYQPGKLLNLGLGTEEILAYAWVEPLKEGSLP